MKTKAIPKAYVPEHSYTRFNVKTPLKKGDVLWISFNARLTERRKKIGEAYIQVRMDRLVDGKYVWPPHMERGILIDANWGRTSIPFLLHDDVLPTDTVIIFMCEGGEKIFEIEDLTFSNYGPNVELVDLPRTPVRYGGGDPHAQWRKEAAKRIEKIRKGDFTIKVIDAKGDPVKGASVSARMKRIAFNWGVAIASDSILDTSADGEKYRQTILQHFNQVVEHNDMKWERWQLLTKEDRGVKTKKVNTWCRENKLGIRATTLVWPAWKRMPSREHLRGDTEGLRTAIMDGLIEQTQAMQGEFDEWDVINEPVKYHDVLDELGQEEMVRWLQATRDIDPNAKLFVNEYTMFQGRGEGSLSQQYFDMIRFLQERGAPIDAIAEQAHITATPPSIPFVLERLDHFAQLGLPILISELDINSDDDDFKARYLEDFLIAVFSHPSVTGVVQWGFWESEHWAPDAALWRKDWTLRKHGKVFTNLVTKDWRTDFEGRTSVDGVSRVRAFCGEYEVEVTHLGMTTKKTFVLTNNGGEILISV
jgi:endo-1,4-beta-xylanase